MPSGSDRISFRLVVSSVIHPHNPIRNLWNADNIVLKIRKEREYYWKSVSYPLIIKYLKLILSAFSLISFSYHHINIGLERNRSVKRILMRDAHKVIPSPISRQRLSVPYPSSLPFLTRYRYTSYLCPPLIPEGARVAGRGGERRVVRKWVWRTCNESKEWVGSNTRRVKAGW